MKYEYEHETFGIALAVRKLCQSNHFTFWNSNRKRRENESEWLREDGWGSIQINGVLTCALTRNFRNCFLKVPGITRLDLSASHFLRTNRQLKIVTSSTNLDQQTTPFGHSESKIENIKHIHQCKSLCLTEFAWSTNLTIATTFQMYSPPKNNGCLRQYRVLGELTIWKIAWNLPLSQQEEEMILSSTEGNPINWVDIY